MADIDIKKIGGVALAETVFLLAISFIYNSFVVSTVNGYITSTGFQLSVLGLDLSLEVAVALLIVFMIKGLLITLIPKLKKYT